VAEVKASGAACGYVVRELDGFDAMMALEMTGAAAEYAVYLPEGDAVSLAWRVGPDGREELVRGLTFTNLNATLLRSALGFGREPVAHHSALGIPAPISFVSPPVLLGLVQAHPRSGPFPRPPLLPRP
jgi:hypothetical protein